jgi:tetratricopeptide (TPR) repeat protein
MENSIINKRVDSVREFYNQAFRVFKAGDIEEAEMICRRGLPAFRKDPNLLCLLGECRYKQRSYQEARQWFSEALNQYKDFPRALEGTGLALIALKRPGKAVDFLKKAAAIVPNRSDSHFALGRALSATGQAIEAERAFERAFELNPVKASIARAVAAQRDNRMEEAEKALRKILADDPDNVTALRLLGNIGVENNRWPAAHRLLGRAVKLAPDFVLAWNDLAGLYMREERFEEALEKVGKAIELDPRMPFSHIMHGNILAKAQRHEESLEAYNMALELSPLHGGALSGKGHVLKTIGRQAESIEAYRLCIQTHPALGEAYWSLANLKTFEFNSQEVEVMMRMVEDEGLADEPKVNMLLSLGKHFENESEYDRAFAYYQRGNDLRRANEIYDPVQTEVIHNRIIEVFDRSFFESRQGYGDPDASPILVVGLPRSGSTLIEQILASHSQVEGTMELPDLSRLIRDMNRKQKGRSEYPEIVQNLTSEECVELGQQYLSSTMRYRSGKAFFIDKMPNNFPMVGFLQMILPNAKVINARRHPLDSCLGSYKQLFFKGQSFTYDMFELGEYYLQYQRIMDHWHQVLPGKVLDIHYDQMVLDQENQTRRILEYCGLPWEDQCLRFYETKRAVNTASSEQVRQPIYTKALNFWRHYESHLGELIEILQPLLKDLPEKDQPQL